jgi:hypothetical protein
MPYASDRAARLFYDDSCGPCRLLARAAEGVSRHHVVATPLTDASADRPLGALPYERRYGYAHLATGGPVLTGAALTTPLVGVTLGPRAEAVVRRLPPVERSIRWAYERLWEYRRTHGCAARSTG